MSAVREAPDVAEHDLERAFDRTVAEGEQRLNRRWPSLVMTGLVGGIDVMFGVVAYYVVLFKTGNSLLASIGFTLAFIILTLAQSEVFTEDFLVPVAAVVARRAGPLALARLWVVTLVANLAGAWCLSWIVMVAYPELHPTADRTAAHYVALAGTARGFALAVLAGALMTLLTWMQHNTDNIGVRLVPAVACGFLLAGGQLLHSVLDSLYAFTALHTSAAPFGYLDWAKMLGWAVAGNVVGGVGLVTLLRLAQVPHKVNDERSGSHSGAEAA